ncbi:hypothetical protein TNCV_3059961 [Trichonephila clavipes]|nr:hypothetical protein TNCV_3059961 [Trichonephila clavipes]
MDDSEQHSNCRACLRLESRYSEIVTMTSRHHLIEDLRWRAIGRIEAEQSKIGVMSPDLASKAGVFLFGGNLEFVFTHNISVQKMHTEQTMSAF